MYIEFSSVFCNHQILVDIKINVAPLFESLLILRSQLLAKDKNGRIELFTDREMVVTGRFKEYTRNFWKGFSKV